MASEPAHARFDRFLRSTKTTTVALGRRWGRHPSTFSHIRKGARRPGRELAVLIERLTSTWDEGPILVRDWPIEDAQTKAA